MLPNEIFIRHTDFQYEQDTPKINKNKMYTLIMEIKIRCR